MINNYYLINIKKYYMINKSHESENNIKRKEKRY